MASIETRTLKSGAKSHKVIWWRDGKREAFTTDNRDYAQLMKRLLDANGNDFAKAKRIIDEQLDTGPTVQEMMFKHVDLITNASVYTIKRYKNAIEQHFGEHFGALKVSKVQYEDVIEWVKYMQGKGLSARSIGNHHGLLSASMKRAVMLRHRQDNPCVGVKIPKETEYRETSTFLTKEQWNRVYENIDPHYQLFFEFLVSSGLRFSEATALKASDFILDVEPHSVRVTKAWKEDERHGYYVGPPKTPKANRTVALPEPLVAKLRPVVAAAGDGLVFRQPRGGAIRSSAAHKVWGPACTKAGLEKRPRIHDLRHTHASWMVQIGFNMFDLSYRLGHTSFSMTADKYSHLMPDAHFVAAAAVTKALSGTNPLPEIEVG